MGCIVYVHTTVQQEKKEYLNTYEKNTDSVQIDIKPVQKSIYKASITLE